VAILPSPTGSACEPLRWWQTGVVLAFCAGGKQPGPLMYGQLWAVPVSGSPPTAISRLVNPIANPNSGAVDVGAWQIPSGAYVQQIDIACSGAWWISKLNADLMPSQVNVPGAVGNVTVVGAYANELEVLTELNCSDFGPHRNPPGNSLAFFNPASNAVKVLLGPALKGRSPGGGTVTDALLYQQG
jgi:hypothetical protein